MPQRRLSLAAIATRIPGNAYLLLAVTIFGAAGAVTQRIIDLGAEHTLSGRNPISFCNLLFVGNLCALMLLIPLYRQQLHPSYSRSTFLLPLVFLAILLDKRCCAPLFIYHFPLAYKPGFDHLNRQPGLSSQQNLWSPLLTTSLPSSKPASFSFPSLLTPSSASVPLPMPSSSVPLTHPSPSRPPLGFSDCPLILSPCILHFYLLPKQCSCKPVPQHLHLHPLWLLIPPVAGPTNSWPLTYLHS